MEMEGSLEVLGVLLVIALGIIKQTILSLEISLSSFLLYFYLSV